MIQLQTMVNMAPPQTVGWGVDSPDMAERIDWGGVSESVVYNRTIVRIDGVMKALIAMVFAWSPSIELRLVPWSHRPLC
jgi:hypothetical protein